MKHTIYKKDGTKLCDTHGLEYHGEFMGERYVLCSAESPTPLTFDNGDYVDYRGERFTLKFEPGCVKQSSKELSGSAFSYQDLKFKSCGQEMVDCRFLDYVESDNLVHYSSLPSFSFFAASVAALAERIQVNLDRLYTGESKWTIEVDEDAEGKTDVNIEADRITCWDALGYAYSKFGLPFYMKGRSVRIGGMPDDLAKVFKYGQGNGLFKIEKSIDADQGIITRLRVYGSTKNMPYRYYNNLVAPYAVVEVSSCSFSKPSKENVRETATGVYECTTDMTIICSPAPEKIGQGSIVRVPGGLKLFTGTNATTGLPDTIISEDFVVGTAAQGSAVIEEMSQGQYKVCGVRVSCDMDGLNNYEIELVTGGVNPYCTCKKNGVQVGYGTTFAPSPQTVYNKMLEDWAANDEDIVGYAIPDYNTFSSMSTNNYDENGMLHHVYKFTDDRHVYYTVDEAKSPSPDELQVIQASADSVIGESFLTGNHNGSLLPDNMSVQNLMLPSFPETTLDPYIDSENIEKYGVIEGDVFFDGSDEDLGEICPSLEGVTAQDLIDSGVEILPAPNGTLSGEIEMDTILGSGGYFDDGIFGEGEEVPNFEVYVRDMGFDLSTEFRRSEKCSISFKSGQCNGMEFEVSSCKREDGTSASGGYARRYVLTCEREELSGTGIYVPNNQYSLGSGNKFVLLGIEMPSVYVKAASQRLLEAGKEYLKTVDTPKKIYIPSIDEEEMARQHDKSTVEGTASIHDTLTEGMRMPMSDADILGGQVSVTIDTLTIKENYDSLIPLYEVTLRDEKEEGTLSSLQSQIEGGTGAQSSVNAQYAQAPIIKTTDERESNDNEAYSSLRTDAEISKAVGELSARLAEEFLSRLEPDTAHGLIKFMNGLNVGDAVDSMTAGRGILADVLGRIQAQRLEVRGSMTVMDLVINEIHAMAGDYSFTDSGAIDAVEDLGNGTYRLWLRKDTDYDVTSLDENDIVYSIINNLKLGGTDYKTSWMRVVAKNVNNNTLTVLPYPDAEVPGGTNYPPQPGYNLTRRGNSTMPETGGTNERAQAWLLSSREGRIMFLANVYKPILEDYNYALTIGKLPNLKALERFAIPQGSIGITTQYMIAEKFFEFDYNGDVVPRHVERGAWSLEVAKSDKPYRNVSTTIPEAGGTTYTLLSRDVVTHSGCRWACLTDKTQLEPKWNSTGWEMIEGDSRYSLFFESSRGSSFFAGGVDTVLTAHVRFGQIDITDELMGMSATEVEWARDSGNESMDRSWKPTYNEGAANAIHLTDADMPAGFGSTVRTLAFICRVFIPVGEEPLAVEGRIGVSI